MARSPKKWEEIIAEFEDDLFRKGKSHRTMAVYGSILKSFGKFYNQTLKKPGPYVSRLQEADLEAYVDYLRSTRYLAKQYLCAAGRPDLSGRDLRHHMAQVLFEKEKDLALVQQVLGLQHISTTARYTKGSENETN